MGYASVTLMSESSTSLISVGGLELPNSRRVLDLQDAQGCRHQYTSSNGIDVRIEYSADQGSTWALLIDEYSMTGTNPKVSGWQVVPDDAKQQEVVLRAFAVGAGLLTTVNFVEFQFR